MAHDDINPANKAHAELRARVVACAEANGYWAVPSGQEDTIPNEARDAIGRRYAPDALAIRTASDLTMIHKSGRVFYCDPKSKSGRSARYSDVMIEWWPLLKAVKRAYDGEINTLFPCHVPRTQKDVGIWGTDIAYGKVPIEVIFADPRRGKDVIAKVRQDAAHYFPGVEVVEFEMDGSGDPCVKIAAATLEDLPHWEKEIAEWPARRERRPHTFALAARVIEREWEKTVQRVIAYLRDKGWTITPPAASEV